jgi:hypothetical protein
MRELQKHGTEALERFHSTKLGSERDEAATMALDVRDPLAPPGVVSGAPARVNERMAAQQGLFILGTNVTVGFENNLAWSLGIATNETPAPPFEAQLITQPKELLVPPLPLCIKFSLAPEIRNSALRELRLMNITAATLYPGIDGYARHLHTRLRINDLVDIVD